MLVPCIGVQPVHAAGLYCCIPDVKSRSYQPWQLWYDRIASAISACRVTVSHADLSDLLAKI